MEQQEVVAPVAVRDANLITLLGSLIGVQNEVDVLEGRLRDPLELVLCALGSLLVAL